MSYSFRLIYDRDHDGASNMARDEAVSLSVSRSEQLPTVRFYGWSPPSISLGMSQRISSVNEEKCRANGVDVVRRSTGGLAIFHTDELTYSIAMPAAHPLAEGDILTSYRRISEAIMDALRALGVKNVQANRVAKEDKATSPVCFEAPSDYEVVGAGKKLVGSAQWRRLDGVLQHGSLPLSGDIARVCEYLVGAPDAARVRDHAATLHDVIGRFVDWQEAASIWRASFERVLDIEFFVGELSQSESECADALRVSKYANDDWTRRK